MLALVKLEPLAARKPDKLSGGQQQRVALARALVKRPKLLLLDEPLAALDKKLREHTQFELANLQYQLGTTFVVVTHDQDEAMTLASRIAVMAEGRIAQVGTPGEVYEYPGEPLRRGLRRQHQPDRRPRHRRGGRARRRCTVTRSNADLAVPATTPTGAGSADLRRRAAGEDHHQPRRRRMAHDRNVRQGHRARPRLFRRPVAVSRAPAERRGPAGERAEPAALREADRRVGRRGVSCPGKSAARSCCAHEQRHGNGDRLPALAAPRGDACRTCGCCCSSSRRS